MHSRRRCCIPFLIALVIILCQLPPNETVAQSKIPPRLCYGKHWRPEGVRLKDHSLFRYDGFYYLVSINLPETPDGPHYEDVFAYARTRDFCTWEDLGSVLGIGQPGDPDEFRIWAPHVIASDQTWYMFYTGVNRNIAQTIMLATSTNPADPASWTRRGAVFRPTHPEAQYPGPQAWSDARDPMVLYDSASSTYIMYYSGTDKQGCLNGMKTCGIVGAATATRLDGPWEDKGPVFRLSTAGIPESVFVVVPGIDNSYYLFFNHATPGSDKGQKVVVAASPLGPWRRAERFLPGWASEFLRDNDTWLMSYLGAYTVAVTRVVWNMSHMPARPMNINEQRVFIPALLR